MEIEYYTLTIRAGLFIEIFQMLFLSFQSIPNGVSTSFGYCTDVHHNTVRLGIQLRQLFPTGVKLLLIQEYAPMALPEQNILA